MKLLSELPTNIDDSIVSIGVFDGVHLGHQFLFRKLCETASKKSKKSVIITFKNHPMSIIDQKFQPKFLMSLSDRLEKLSSTGVDYVIPITFDRKLANLSAKEFVAILKETINLSEIIAGPDFALGRNREGDIDKLVLLGQEMEYTVNTVPLFAEGDVTIHSSGARKELSAGNIKSLNALLGRRFTLSGSVHAGNKIGSELGFPTANISVDSNLAIPPDGIYATWVTIDNATDNQIWMGATSIGTRPTFEEYDNLTIETYLLNFDKDIYNQAINVEFVHKIRDQTKFSSENSLIEQMRIDIDIIKNILITQR